MVTIATGVIVYKHWLGPYHLATVQSGVLYRDGGKSIHQMSRAVEQTGARTVVSLVDDQEINNASKPQFAEEEPYLKSHGVYYQRIPVKLGGWPTSGDIQAFLHTVADPTSRPVLIHCAQGVRRTAMFVAAYQESVLGYDKTRAKAAIVSFGHSDRTIDDIVRFIDNYDPKSCTVGDLSKQ